MKKPTNLLGVVYVASTIISALIVTVTVVIALTLYYSDVGDRVTANGVMISNLQSDFSDMKDDISDIKNAMAGLIGYVRITDKLDKDFDILRADVKSLNGDVISNTTKIGKISGE